MYGDVILTRDVPGRGLRAGDVGTVVEHRAVRGFLSSLVERVVVTATSCILLRSSRAVSNCASAVASDACSCGIPAAS